ncbi:MAG: HAD-IB family phosphatase [Oscillospiraceae bacterium]|nr:HAD-IB family phosphatase [Oscillospiraceae bacterium]
MRVFDFDNTIYDGESGLDLFLHFLRLDTKGVFKYIPKFFKGFIKYKNGVITIDEVINKYGTFLKEYCDGFADDMEKEFVRFWDLNEHKIKKFYRDIHKADDIIVSACPESLLKIMCDRLGINNYICSKVNFSTGDIQQICYKDKKVALFKEKYGDVQIDEFYTDSVSDLPMIEISRNAYMVSGDQIRIIKKDGIMLEKI